MRIPRRHRRIQAPTPSNSEVFGGVQLDYAGAAPYALLMVLASLPLTLLLYAQSERVGGR